MSKAATYYLAFYNFAAFVFWLLYITTFTAVNFTLTPASLLLLNVAQGLAVLEIAHAAFKLVKSPVVSTTVQVASRMFVLMLVNIFMYRHTLTGLAYTGLVIVSLAWSVTELVRYPFYFFNVLNRQFNWLTWMRYTFFIVLYPLGVTGEALIILSPLTRGGAGLNAYTVFAAVVGAAYVYYFPVLYKYMWKQRKARI